MTLTLTNNPALENSALIEDGGKTLTHDELAALIGRLGEEHQLTERPLVFILCRNNARSISAYFACLEYGAVPLLLGEKIDSELLKNLLEIYRPNLIFYPDGLTEKYSDEKHRLHKDLALLLPTSGSMGSPKLVRQSYRNIEANTESIISYLKINACERAITTLPMNYTYGLSIINTHIAAGATLLLTDKGILQKEFWDFFKTECATSFGGVPYTYEMLKRLRFFGMNLPALNYFTQAGGKLSTRLHEEFANFAAQSGKKFIVMYGQTEATARMSYLPFEMSLKKIGSIGVAIPGGKFDIKNPGADGSGELVYSGENVTLGYAENIADLAKGDERGGVLETGDIARVDEDGYYYITGRAKRFLKIFGNRVNLDEVENMVKENLDTDCACAGEDDHMKIYITDGKLAATAKNFIAEKIGVHPSSLKVETIDEIPKNEAGKILYSALP